MWGPLWGRLIILSHRSIDLVKSNQTLDIVFDFQASGKPSVNAPLYMIPVPNSNIPAPNSVLRVKYINCRPVRGIVAATLMRFGYDHV